MDSPEAYRKKLEEIAEFAFRNGIRSIGVDQFFGKPLDVWSCDTYEKFYIACHDGFKKAQHLLINEIKTYQSELREIKKKLKVSRRERNNEKVNDLSLAISIIEQRLQTLAHVADGIGWQLIGGEIHIARRFHIGENSIKYLDESNIEHAIGIANEINSNPLSFALISDLTNYIQIGDLLVRHQGELGIIELKQGKVNDQIIEYLDDCNKNSLKDEELNRKFNPSTVKQVKRMQRQQVRMERAVKVINDDKGIDPISGMAISTPEPQIPTEHYHQVLNILREELDRKFWAYDVIDSCLHVGIYRDEGLLMANFLLNSIIGNHTSNYIVVDWLAITRNLSEPIFLKPLPTDFVIDILTGKIKVMIGLDFDALIRTWNSVGLNTRWMSEKETGQYKQNSVRKGLFEVNNKGIIASKPGIDKMIVHGGLISKMLYDCIKPTNIALSLLAINKKTAANNMQTP